MGMNFLAVMVGAAFSGVTYTSLYGHFETMGRPEYVWFVLGAHTVLGIGVLSLFTRLAGVIEEQEE